MAKKRKKRVLPVRDGMRDATWANVEAALNDLDLESVWVSQLLYLELLDDPVDPADPDEYQVLPPSIPGRLMVMLYNRHQSNVRILPFDQEGSAYTLAFMRNPRWDELLPTVFSQSGVEA